MNNKINRMIIIPAITLIFLAMVLVPVSAKTVVTHRKERGAWGYWRLSGNGGDWYSITIEAFESKESITLSIRTYVSGVLDEEYDKELDPSEFMWSVFYCWVSTDIDGYSLTVEWDLSSLRPPPIKSHSNEWYDGTHVIRNDVWREDPTAPDYSTMTTDLPPFPEEVTLFGHGEVGTRTIVTITK